MELIQEKPNKQKKAIGQFKNTQELLDYKLVIVNKLLSQIDPKVLENLGKK